MPGHRPAGQRLVCVECCAGVACETHMDGSSPEAELSVSMALGCSAVKVPDPRETGVRGLGGCEEPPCRHGAVFLCSALRMLAAPGA